MKEELKKKINMTGKIELIPAIMPKSLADIEDKVTSVKGLVKTVQLDFMDGKYVPEITWPFSDEKFLEKEEIELPFWDDINYELDLMVSEPEKKLDLWLKFSPARIIFHYASIKDFQKIKDFSNQVGGFIEIGFAVQRNDNLDEVLELIKGGTGEFIQCMGIEKIGYQEEKFDERILEIIKTIREKSSDLPISIDGGVNKESVRSLVQSGATRIVSGSAIFNSEDVKLSIEEIRNLF